MLKTTTTKEDFHQLLQKICQKEKSDEVESAEEEDAVYFGVGGDADAIEEGEGDECYSDVEDDSDENHLEHEEEDMSNPH